MNIGIIGFGLIGGSIAKSIKKNRPGYQITAYSRKLAPLEKAASEGVVDRYSNNDLSIFSDSDIIIICTPVDMICEYINNLLPYIKNDCILTDAGSTKAAICKNAFEIAGTKFIGGHPMAGAEKTGYDAARENLFLNAFYILTPPPGVDDNKLTILKNIVKDIGAVCIVMEPDKHDRAVAAISHAPHAIAYALVNMIKNRDCDDKYMYHLAAGGFRDITRIASSGSEMWQSIMIENKSQILDALNAFKMELIRLEEAISKEDTDFMYNYFNEAKNYRDSFEIRGWPARR